MPDLSKIRILLEGWGDGSDEPEPEGPDICRESFSLTCPGLGKVSRAKKKFISERKLVKV